MEYLPKVTHAFDDKHTRYYLMPGKVFVATQPFAVSIITGSGICLCLWDSDRHIGGANHFILPEGPEESENAMRYANVANPALLQQILDLGADTKTLTARIFGGSLPSIGFKNEKECLGALNVQAVTRFLKTHRIRIKQREVGGTHGRKVIFHTDDGRTFWEPL